MTSDDEAFPPSRSGGDEEEPRRASGQQDRLEQEKQERAAREQMLRIVFTSEARERLSNIRITRPDLAKQVENQIFQLAATGRIKSQITDEELKQMLSSLQQPKREFKINWK